MMKPKPPSAYNVAIKAVPSLGCFIMYPPIPFILLHAFYPINYYNGPF
jgi:hypothetical protein